MSDQTSRRAFMAAAAAGAVALPSAAKAAVTCQPSYYGRTCEAGIPSRRIDKVARLSRQEMQNWCWAASMQLLFRHHGYYVSQSQIVSRVFGGIMDQPVPGHVIANAVTSVWMDSMGRQFRPRALVLIDVQLRVHRPNAAAIAISDMIQEQPLIIGYDNHASLMTSITYTETPYSAPIIHNVEVRDPWPLVPNQRSLSQSEFLNTNFLMQVRI